MEKICKNCNHWKDQNIPGKIKAEVAELKTGACWKLQRALASPQSFDSRSGIIVIDYAWITGVTYTVESFGCNMFTEKEIVRKRTK